MAIQDTPYAPIDDLDLIEPGPAVSWGAVIAGAFAAAAISFVLLAIGAAFGFSIIEPSEATGEAAAAIGIGAAIFLLIVHAISSGFGGYVAGRLREKLTNLRHDETYFRDTAHGLLVWALSAVAGAVFVAAFSAQVAQGGLTLGAAGLSAAGQGAGAAMSGLTDGADGMAPGRSGRDRAGYYVDSLFRPASPAGTDQTAAPADTTTPPAGGETAPASPTTGSVATMPMSQGAAPAASPHADRMVARSEVGRILRVSLADGEISAEDKTYVAQLISAETGLPQAEAEARVDDVIARAGAAREEIAATAREAADAAATAAQATAIWSAIAMLVGAFCACLAATWGGKARDLPGR